MKPSSACSAGTVASDPNPGCQELRTLGSKPRRFVKLPELLGLPQQYGLYSIIAGASPAELATGHVAVKKKGLLPSPVRRASLIQSPATWPVSEAMQAIPRRVLLFGRAAPSYRGPANAGSEAR